MLLSITRQNISQIDRILFFQYPASNFDAPFLSLRGTGIISQQGDSQQKYSPLQRLFTFLPCAFDISAEFRSESLHFFLRHRPQPTALTHVRDWQKFISRDLHARGNCVPAARIARDPLFRWQRLSSQSRVGKLSSQT